MREFTHLDLFSGIGGFALAANLAGYETVAFVEIDKYCQKLLQLRFKGVPVYGDIREFGYDRFVADTLLRKQQKQQECNNKERTSTRREARNCFGSGASGGDIVGHTAKGMRELGRDTRKLQENISGEEYGQCKSSSNSDIRLCECEERKIQAGRTTSFDGCESGSATDTKHSGFCKTKISEEDIGTQPQGETRQKLCCYESEGDNGIRTDGLGRKTIDLLTGGFPCQPFSNAGKKRGKKDDRYLWPEMLRVIKEFRPRWIVGENVAGIIGMVQSSCEDGMDDETCDEESCEYGDGANGILYEIISNLEEIGYSIQTFCIPACSVSAPHKRNRVFIVAHDKQDRQYENFSEDSISTRTWDECGECGDDRREVCRDGEESIHEVRSSCADGNNTADTDVGSSKCRMQGGCGIRMWDTPWIQVATRFCGMDDGISAKVDGLELSASRHRMERIKGLGNAIVVPLVYQIMKSIHHMDSQVVRNG